MESVSSHAVRGGTSSQNSLLPHDLCRTVCVLQLSYMDVNAAVLLQLVMLMQAPPFAVQIEPTMFKRYLQSDTSFVWLFDSTCLWCVLFLSRIKPYRVFENCFLLWNMPIGKLWYLRRYILWDRCLVYTSYRNAGCCGSIPIATED